jgi:hypothetical protein
MLLIALLGVVLVLGAGAGVLAYTTLGTGTESAEQENAPESEEGDGSDGANGAEDEPATPETETTVQSSPPLTAVLSASGEVPSSISASSTAPSAQDAGGRTYTYNPENAVDGDRGTAWQVEGDGSGEYILIEYEEPVVVNSVGMIPGYDKIDPISGTDRFYQRNVVEEAEIEFSDGSSVEAEFDREPQVQFTEVPETETEYVRITILDTYPPENGPDGAAVDNSTPVDITAISEVEVEGP